MFEREWPLVDFRLNQIRIVFYRKQRTQTEH